MIHIDTRPLWTVSRGCIVQKGGCGQNMGVTRVSSGLGYKRVNVAWGIYINTCLWWTFSRGGTRQKGGCGKNTRVKSSLILHLVDCFKCP